MPVFLGLMPLLVPFLLACHSAPSQLPAVERLVARSRLVRIACLDSNGDGWVDAADAGAGLQDITGDGAVDDGDREVLRRVSLRLPAGRPPECAGGHPAPDWQASPPADADCARGESGLLVLGVGGGAVELSNTKAAAGMRWMLEEIGDDLSARGVPHQLLSVAPGLGGTEQPQPDAETWASTYLSAELARRPCLRAVLIGHSHGGVVVTAVASRLEQAGLDDRVLLAVPVDRVTVLYAGDSASMPQTVRVFNVYQTNDGLLPGAPIEQANVDNWDASRVRAPADGERGGRLRSVNHTTIDNSEAVLGKIRERIVPASVCHGGSCR